MALAVMAGGAQAAQATTWSVDNPSVQEGDSGTTQITFTVTGSNLPLWGSDSIGYHTQDGTATAGSDYVAATGTASVSTTPVLGGSASTQVTVDVNGDTAAEHNETFQLVLDDGTTGTGTIQNDDLPHITINDPSVSEHDGSATFTISIDGPGNVSLHYATADGTATAGQDYQATSGTLNLSGSTTSRQVAVPVINDGVHEDSETFALNLTSLSGVAGSANKLSGTATIADDDALAAPPPAAPATQPGGTTSGGGNTIGTSGSSLTDATNPQPALTKPRSKRGTIVIAIGCPATELLCRGTLTTFVEPNRHSRIRWLHRERKLGSATFVITGGKRAFITTRIGRSALRKLRHAGKVSIRSYAVVRDAAGNIGTASVAARLARVR
ncbi:MAG TPA: Calx-beta domain-containing protein [Solirubrobacteraceae bacterium]|nr:Calx-beta domain-containing protein [Solirubrobacteraceae bacterium]